MKIDEFRAHAHEMVDWMANYLENISDLPVKSTVPPRDIYKRIPVSPPFQSEDFQEIMKDFNDIIMPGITHWQSPSFFAYFPANSSYPSVLAEMLTATIGAQCMVWETSPAAAELEERVMDWLKKMCGLPEHFHGVIQDTASTSTLAAILTARENYSDFKINDYGFDHNKYRIYCSSEAHSSVEKAVKIAGFGKKNLVKIRVDEMLSMIPAELEINIRNDIQNGFIPLCLVAAIGTTGTAAVDPLKDLAYICKKHNIWLHVDAAYAGTAFLLPEYRHLLDGIESADSYVFNPHKWMFTNFDCSAYFVKNKDALVKTFEIMPEYLKTSTDQLVNNYRDWGIPLGRRFRSLKLWFVIRSMGISGMQEKIRNHIVWAKWIAEQIKSSEYFELLNPPQFGLVCFSIRDSQITEPESINKLNRDFLQHLNNSGKLYLSHTKVNGKLILRLVVGQTYTTFEHISNAWKLISKEGSLFIPEFMNKQ